MTFETRHLQNAAGRCRFVLRDDTESKWNASSVRWRFCTGGARGNLRGWLVACAAVMFFPGFGLGQVPVASDPEGVAVPARAAKGVPSLADDQRALAEDYAKLEQKLRRLAQVSSSTDPARAALLKQAFAESKQRFIASRLGELSHLLDEKQSGGTAFDKVLAEQAKAHADLTAVVNLLQNESQAKSVEEESRRLREFAQRIGRIIRTQEGIAGQTESTTDPKGLAKDQEDVADKTEKLGDDAEQHAKAKTGEQGGDSAEQGKPPMGDAGTAGEPSAKPQPAAPRAPDPDAQPEGPSGGKGMPGDGMQGETGEAAEGAGEGASEQQDSLPKRLRDAQKKMKEAQKRLDEAKPKEAAAEQQQAIEQLKAAQAALEKILRQMREEQVERTLEALEQRFRMMLDAQIAVYDETRQLDKTPAAERTAEDDIRAGRLGRREQEVELMCQRALALLRDEGSAAALPEATEQAGADMRRAAELLAQSRTGMETQQTEQDVIAALDQILAAVKQAKEDAKSGQKPQGGSSEGGPPGDPPLVDMIAELKMLRTMQSGVNRRIKSLTEQLQTSAASGDEIRKAIEDLGSRQKRIVRITRDIVTGKTE